MANNERIRKIIWFFSSARQHIFPHIWYFVLLNIFYENKYFINHHENEWIKCSIARITSDFASEKPK